MPVVAMYSLWLTKKYKKNVSYVCPNCHEIHYCVEIAKQ